MQDFQEYNNITVFSHRNLEWSNKSIEQRPVKRQARRAILARFPEQVSPKVPKFLIRVFNITHRVMDR